MERYIYIGISNIIYKKLFEKKKVMPFPPSRCQATHTIQCNPFLSFFITGFWLSIVSVSLGNTRLYASAFFTWCSRPSVTLCMSQTCIVTSWIPMEFHPPIYHESMALSSLSNWIPFASLKIGRRFFKSPMMMVPSLVKNRVRS